jgi:hypothetical protein
MIKLARHISLSNKQILAVVMIIAAILRFFNYDDIPFTHDEFSALFRLKFDSFYELIEKGVKIDGHPAGVQVFLYYWTKLFGTIEWVVKFPFTIFGIFSIYFIFLIGKKWFNETVGLIAAVYVASLQFTIMYSQMARPYISGFFFGLVMVNFLTNLILKPERNFLRNILFFIISASICTYNHHFSLLFAFIVGVTGIILIKKEYRLKYLLAGLIVFVLYIPHLRIFFYQLGVGGVGGEEGWLGKPNSDFLFQFIFYIFNYSFVALILSILIAITGIIYWKERKIKYQFILISVIWFLTPFLIGYFYSIYYNPVLQYSVLIFSFPFLFFFMFAFLKEQSARVNLLLVILISLVNISTLIFQRKHYDLMYKSIFEHAVLDFKQNNCDTSTTIFLVDSEKKRTDYFVRKHRIRGKFIYISEKPHSELKQLLEKEKKRKQKLYLGCLSSIHPNVVPLIQDYFPTIEIQNNYFGGTTYVFSKEKNKTIQYIDFLDFNSPISSNWTSIEKNKIINSTSSPNQTTYHLTKDVEWGPTFAIPLMRKIKNKNNFIDISVEAKSEDSLSGIVLVASLESNGKSIYWGGTDFSELNQIESNSNEMQRFHHSIKLSDIYLNHTNLELKIYIWNKNKRDFFIDNFNIVLREGNPFVYGLIDNF